MDPFAILWQSASEMTGGIITDMRTAMIAILAILFILAGLDFLKDIFLESSDMKRAERYREKYLNASSEVERDVYRSRYKRTISRISRRD